MFLSDAIHGFYLYMISGNYSPTTAENYRRFLRIVSEHLDNPQIEEITTKQITDFFAYLRENQRTESTVQVYWRTIRSLYNWASTELEIKKRPDAAIPAPRFVTRVIEPFTRDEVYKLLKACLSKRDKAIVMLLLDTGLRVSEAARLTLEDVDLESGGVRVRAWHNGKKSKPRVVRLGANARRVLWSYISGRTDPQSKTTPFLATNAGKPLERYGLGNILERIGNRAQVEGVHPHRFRHTFAIEFLRNGGNIFELQVLLGHSSLEMVRHYLSIAESDLETAHKRASPVDNWRL